MFNGLSVCLSPHPRTTNHHLPFSALAGHSLFDATASNFPITIIIITVTSTTEVCGLAGKPCGCCPNTGKGRFPSLGDRRINLLCENFQSSWIFRRDLFPACMIPASSARPVRVSLRRGKEGQGPRPATASNHDTIRARWLSNTKAETIYQEIAVTAATFQRY